MDQLDDDVLGVIMDLLPFTDWYNFRKTCRRIYYLPSDKNIIKKLFKWGSRKKECETCVICQTCLCSCRCCSHISSRGLGHGYKCFVCKGKVCATDKCVYYDSGVDWCICKECGKKRCKCGKLIFTDVSMRPCQNCGTYSCSDCVIKLESQLLHIYCSNCFEKRCSCGEEWYYDDLRDIAPCEVCNKYKCQECSYECNRCFRIFCYSCRPNYKCGNCENILCSGCEDRCNYCKLYENTKWDHNYDNRSLVYLN